MVVIIHTVLLQVCSVGHMPLCDLCWLVMVFSGPKIRLRGLESGQTFPKSLGCVVTTVRALLLDHISWVINTPSGAWVSSGNVFRMLMNWNSQDI